MTTATCRQPLPDVQSTVDTRKIAIDRVGVKGITLPMTVKSVAGAQPTVATVNMYVALPAEHKGTHMSRFVALLSENLEALSEPMMRELLAKMLTLLEADGGRIEITCPFFVMKASPVSGLKSLMNYEVRFVAEKVKGETTGAYPQIRKPVLRLQFLGHLRQALPMHYGRVWDQGRDRHASWSRLQELGQSGLH